MSSKVSTQPGPELASLPAASVKKPKSRENKKALIAYFTPSVSRTLRRLAAVEDTTLQALIGEAVDLLMESRKLEPFRER